MTSWNACSNAVVGVRETWIPTVLCLDSELDTMVCHVAEADFGIYRKVIIAKQVSQKKETARSNVEGFQTTKNSSKYHEIQKCSWWVLEPKILFLASSRYFVIYASYKRGIPPKAFFRLFGGIW